MKSGSVWSWAHVQTYKPLSVSCDHTRTIRCTRELWQSHSNKGFSHINSADRSSPNIAHLEHVSHRICLCVVEWMARWGDYVSLRYWVPHHTIQVHQHIQFKFVFILRSVNFDISLSVVLLQVSFLVYNEDLILARSIWGKWLISTFPIIESVSAEQWVLLTHYSAVFQCVLPRWM